MDMQEFYFERSHHVPAFGSWDCYDDLPFTQCFESARQTGMLRYSYSEEERDLYENHILTPAMILIPRSTGKTAGYQKEKQGKKDARVTCESDLVTVAKAVDEDLYKISPHILRQHDKKKTRGWGIFSSCLRPTCS